MTDPNQDDRIREIELPQPTASPMVTAFGFTLMLAGLVTNWIVAVVGFLVMMVGIVKWFHQSNPESKEMPATPAAVRATPIVPRPGGVAHLMSDADHRARIPVTIHPYSAGIVGGMLGGVVMAVLAVVWGIVMHGSPWYTINLLAGCMFADYADQTTEQLYAFQTAGLIVAVMIQAVMSISVGLLYGVAMPLIPRFHLLFAAILVPLMWSGLTWASISVINPALSEHINWLWFVICQIAFGLVAGWWILRSEKVSTMQNWHYAERFGVHSPGVRDLGDSE
jgi:hypothetical protein